MRRMTQAQYSAIVARQRQLQQARNKQTSETKPNTELNTANANNNATRAISELNEKVAQREQLDNELKNTNKNVEPPAAVPKNFQATPSITQQTRLPVMSSKNVAENIRQNISMKKNMTNDDIDAANELHSNYDKLENIKVEVIEKENVKETESVPAPAPKNDVVTAAAVKNFEMIFNNTNTLMEKYKNHAAMIEKQNENLTTTYERKLRSNEITIENLTKTVNELSGVIKELTAKIKILTPEPEKPIDETPNNEEKIEEQVNIENSTHTNDEEDGNNLEKENVEETDNNEKTNDEE